MKAIDLTQFIATDMPVYPGTEGPKIVNATTIAQDGFAEKLLSMYSHTGWDTKWDQDSYFSGFPVLSAEAAHLLCGLGLKGLGFDCISVDPVGSTSMAIHKILLGAGLVIVENLCNLSRLHNKVFTFSCLPLRIQDSDGSPVRAVAVQTD